MNSLYRGRIMSALPWALAAAMGIYMWTSATSPSYPPAKGGFILTIAIRFNTHEGLDDFKRRFAEYAHWIRQNEKSTVSYEFCQSDKNELAGLIIELYTTKEAYTDVHRKSHRFLEFKAGIVSMNDEENRAKYGWELTGESYVPTNIGFL